MIEQDNKNLPQRIFNGNSLPKINTGQEALFLLICQALKERRIVQYKEIRYIYLTVVQMSDHIDCGYWDDKTKKWISKSRKYSDWEIETYTQAWLLRALGALIKKGYLLVLPRIELKKTLTQ